MVVHVLPQYKIVYMVQDIIYLSGILERTYSFNIALLDKSISQFTEHPVFTQGNIWQKATHKECTVIYSPPREGSGVQGIYCSGITLP